MTVYLFLSVFMEVHLYFYQGRSQNTGLSGPNFSSILRLLA